MWSALGFKTRTHFYRFTCFVVFGKALPRKVTGAFFTKGVNSKSQIRNLSFRYCLEHYQSKSVVLSF